MRVLDPGFLTNVTVLFVFKLSSYNILVKINIC